MTDTSALSDERSHFRQIFVLPVLLEKKINNVFPHSQTLARCVPQQGRLPFVLEEESSWEQTDIATWKCLGEYF